MLKSIAGDGEGWLIIDDLVDTGHTARVVREMLPKAHFATVYAKPAGRPLVDTFVTEVSQDTWILFPWDIEPQFAPPHRQREGAAIMKCRFLAAIGGLVLLPRLAARAEPSRRDMIATANPLASEAGRAILREGGSAVDAAIAAQMVLNLVEPRILGHRRRRVHGAVVGEGAPRHHLRRPRDRARRRQARPFPRRARQAAELFRRAGRRPLGRRARPLAHARSGASALWQAALGGALRAGDPSCRDRLSDVGKAARRAGARSSLRAHGRAAFAVLRRRRQGEAGRNDPPNPELAARLRQRSPQEGADAFYRGAIAADIVATVDHAAVNPGDITAADIAAYKAKERAPVCGFYRVYRLCGMGPPSSGGIAVIEILDLLQPFDLQHQVNTPEAWNLFAQASRLAYADRDRYVADPDFVKAPVSGLLDRAYLDARSKLIERGHFPPGPMAPGDPPGEHADNWGRDATPEFPSTSNLAVVDRDGNALDMTTTIEFAFGSHLMLHGFLLNNELTDFSFVPEDNGKPVANRVEGGKRPRSSMSPTLVFDRHGKLAMSVGSAGGAAIITDVAKTLLAALDWHFGLQRAMDLPNVGNRNGATDVESTHDADALAASLAADGSPIRRNGRASGLSGIRVTRKGFEGAADKRRAGIALGD